MSVETTSKRLTTQIGDTLVITDVEMRQRILPARISFGNLLAAVDVDPVAGAVFVDFEDYEGDLFYDEDHDIPAAKRQLALWVAKMLEADGVVVHDKPE